MKKKIGVLGGAFDPPHIGHLILAECAYRQVGLDEVVFMPYFRDKNKVPVASCEDRIKMTRLAISSVEYFSVDEREIQRAKITYTVDTVSQLLFENPDLEIYWIIGPDRLGTLTSWKDWQKLVKLIKFICASDYSRDNDIGIALGASVCFVNMPKISINSTEIRERIRGGLPIRFMVPEEVYRYIVGNGLYK